MKLISFILSYFLTLNAFAYPIGFKGQKDTASQYSATVNAPNRSITNQGASQSLIETGNTNLLANPSFEHATYDTSWTCSGTGTESKETTVVIDGNASLEVLTSSQTMDCSQVSTLYASQLAGVQGVASIWVNSTSTIAEVCAVVDSVDTDCVTIESSGTWKEYVIPFVMGSINNGIRVKSASDSATTYIDNAFVGVMPATMMPEVSQAQQIGTARTEGNASCSFSTTSTSYTGFPADADCGAQSATGDLLSPSTKKLAFNYNFKNGRYVIRHNANWLHNTTGAVTTCKIVANGISSTEWWHLARDASTTDYFEEMSFILDIPTPFNGEAELQCKVSSGTLSSAMGQTNYFSQFSVEYYPPKSKIYSQQCKSSLDCENVFIAKVSSTGVVSAENLDWINGNAALTDTSLYTFTFNSNVFGLPPTCFTTPDATSASLSERNISVDNATVSTSSVAVRSVNYLSAKTASAFNLICVKSGTDYKEKNVITGTFANVVTAPNIAKPKTCYYAFGGASATLASPTVCAASPCVEVYDSCSAGTAPTRAGSGVYNDLTFANSTWKANTYIHCNCSVWTTTSGTDRECAQSFVTGDNSISTNSSGGYVANFITTTTNGTNSDTYVSIECTADAP
jgi:hypothetical protein